MIFVDVPYPKVRPDMLHTNAALRKVATKLNKASGAAQPESVPERRGRGHGAACCASGNLPRRDTKHQHLQHKATTQVAVGSTWGPPVLCRCSTLCQQVSGLPTLASQQPSGRSPRQPAAHEWLVFQSRKQERPKTLAIP